MAATAAMLLVACGATPSPSGPPSVAPAASSPTATSSPVVTASAEASPTGSAAATAPLEVAVECTSTGTTVATDTVAVQLDGVHFRVSSAEEGRGFQVDGVGGDNAPFPSGTLIWAVPPGDIRIWCGPDQPTNADWVTIHAIDPGGLYAADTLSCASGTHGLIDYAQGARGEGGDPIAIAQRQVLGRRPSDIVEGAGYPATEQRKVRVTRDGAIIAIGTYQPDGRGGWLLGSIETCGDSGIQWQT